MECIVDESRKDSQKNDFQKVACRHVSLTPCV